MGREPGAGNTAEPLLLERRQVFAGRAIDLRVDRVRLPNGHESDLEIIAHPGAAAMVPLTDDNEVLLVRQYRHATGAWLLEVPAGKLAPGEEPRACAERELEEETGYRAGRLDELGWIWTTPGFTDERIWLFVARDLEPGRQSLETDEALSLVSLPWEETLALVEKGEIRDSKSVCSLLLTERFLARRPAAGR